MATLSNKTERAAVNKNSQEEHPRNNMSWDTNYRRVYDDYITQVSEGVERRVTIKLSQEFGGRQDRILGALSKLDNFILSSQERVQSRNVPVTSLNYDRENQEFNQERSQNDLHLEVGTSDNRTPLSNISDPDQVHHTLMLLFWFKLMKEELK